MAASNYQRARSERQRVDLARRIEERHIEQIPEGEREEIRQIFERKGFTGDFLQEVVRVITEDRKRWVDTMLIEELGLPLDGGSPGRAAYVTFLGFVLAGLAPLAPFLVAAFVPVSDLFLWSCLLTALTFFGIGLAKGKVLEGAPLWSGLETLLLGGAAATLAYVAGGVLERLVT